VAPTPAPAPAFNEAEDDIFTGVLGIFGERGEDNGETYPSSCALDDDDGGGGPRLLDDSSLDTGVRAPLREGMENTAWPLAPGEDSMVPNVAKKLADPPADAA